ncbi:MAG TPA: alpha/beta hydrolase, partial [Rhizomicrobium sp.]|nr:alpha/beta hydrolase [Rhizomicrobium sp.]
MSDAVFFFGGYHASQHDIDAWLRSARFQEPTIDFYGYPWPKAAGAGAASAVKHFSEGGRYDATIDDIQGAGADTVYIVGHSSGCAIANAVDAGLEWTENVVLVALDGFRPSDDQLDREKTQVWGAKCGHVHSRNYPGFSKGRRRIYEATNCKTEW